jgi:ATP-dependent protease ClpP protease subunit
MSKFFLICVLFLSVISTVNASVRFEESIDSYGPFCTNFGITIEGEITQADVLALTKAIATINKKSLNRPCLSGKIIVKLNSTGGDIRSAIQLGRIMRKNEAHILVRSGNECSSACVFVFAGGVRRIVPIPNSKFDATRIGIHRPYFSNLEDGLPIAEIRKRRDELNSEIKRYLEEVDVSPALLEAMLSVSPEEIRYLKFGELDTYRLSSEDATFNEKEVARRAFRYGMTSSEFRKRELEASETCMKKASTSMGTLDTSKFSSCLPAETLGVSEAEMQRRQLKVMDNCKTRYGDSAWESCARKIYSVK